MIETAEAAWIANAGDGTVTRLDRKTGEELGTTKVGRDPRQLAFSQGFVWVTNNDDNTVTRLDPKTGRIVGNAIPVGSKPIGIAAGAGSIWVANHGDDTHHADRAVNHGHDRLLPVPGQPGTCPTRRPASSRSAARRTGPCCSTTPRPGASAPGRTS